MEKITTYNYEAFYLDYLEGNLSEEGTVMLLQFLENHPDLKTELELDEDVLDFNLNSSQEVLSKFDKEDLKHFDCKANEICFNNVNDFIVAEVENEISAQKKIELKEFVVEHDLQSTYDYFHATKLMPDLTETYKNKAGLKKKGTLIPLFVKVASVAAVGLLIFNLVKGAGNPTELYSPREGSFALQVDSSNQIFEINNKGVGSTQNGFALIDEHEQQTTDFVVDKQFQSTDTSTVIIKDIVPSDNLTEDFKVEDLKEDHPISPLHEDDNHDIVVSIPSEQSNAEIKLVDMYKPVTNLTNNYTNLDVSYKKSVPESDYAVTAFSIGKFSFERKKKK